MAQSASCEFRYVAMLPLLGQSYTRAEGEQAMAALKRGPVMPEESTSSSVLSNPLWWTLAAVGVAGVAIGTYGLVQGTRCSSEVAGGCIENKEPNKGVSLIYAGAGVAALGGAIVWYLTQESASPKPHRQAKLNWTIGPGNVLIYGQF